jgi:hypothetical protein
MDTPLNTIAAILVLGTFYIVFPAACDRFCAFRKSGVVLCPGTRTLAEVRNCR